jgi:hypothetical protein
VSKGVSDWFGQMHGILFNLIIIAVVLHVGAIVVYLLLKGHNLVRPMITGTKTIEGPVAAPALVSPIRAVLIVVVSAAIVAALVRFL